VICTLCLTTLIDFRPRTHVLNTHSTHISCLKIAPETAIKLTMYDSLKTHVLDWRRRQQQLAYESHVASIQHTSPAYTLTMTPQNVTPPTDTAVSLYAHERLVLGAVSGAVGQLTVYPLEMLRTRIAVAPTGMYEGVSHALFSVAQREGVGALYRGVGASMLGILPYAGVDLMIFEGLKKRMLTAYDTPPPGLNFVSGMVASCVAQFVAYPFALVRTRLQKQGMIEGDTTRYRGIVDCFSQTVRNEGILGLYKGLLPNVLKLAPAAGINWLVFEQAKLGMGIDARS